MFGCIDCGPLEGTFDSRDDLEAHVATVHFNYLPYECEKCRFAKFPTEYSIRYHNEVEHQQTEYLIRYRVSEELLEKRQRIAEFMLRCLLPILPTPASTEPSEQELEEKPSLIMSQIPMFASIPTSSTGGFGCIEPVLPTSDPPVEVSPTFQALFGQSVDKEATLGQVLKTISRKRKRDGKSGVKAEASQCETIQCTGCNRFVANLATSLLYHANSRHLHKPTFSCTACNKVWTGVSRTEVMKHVKAFHNDDRSLIVDRKAEFMPVLRAACQKLFPTRDFQLRRLTDEGVPEESDCENNTCLAGPYITVRCVECRQRITNQSTSLMYHTNSRHTKFPTYTCVPCNKTWLGLSKSEVARHVRVEHDDDWGVIENRKEYFYPAIKMRMKELFPDRGLKNVKKREPYDEQDTEEDAMIEVD